MNLTFVIFTALLFSAVVLLVWGIYTGWHAHRSPEAERIARRLRDVIGGDVRQQDTTIVKQRKLADSAEVDLLLRRVPLVVSLDRVLQQSGAKQLVVTTLAWVAGLFVAGLLGGAMLHLPALGVLALALFAGYLPVLRLTRARTARLAKFERQLPDALDMMGRAMRAGHAFPTALKLAADEMDAPLGEEFKSAFDEVNFGIAMGDALGNLAQRVPSMDLQYFVVAVLIQRESGGNLTELLASISSIVRDRHKLAGQVRVLSAEGRISAWVLCVLPFGAGSMMYLANPVTMSVLVTEPGGRKMLYGALFMMFVGVLLIRKIIRIRM